MNSELELTEYTPMDERELMILAIHYYGVDRCYNHKEYEDYKERFRKTFKNEDD